MAILDNVERFVADLPIHSEVIAGALLLLFFSFVFLFFIPAILQNAKLGRILRLLERVDAKNLNAISEVFKRDAILSHLWAEFRDTLHVQKDLNAQGVYEITGIRQTVPAETYFSEQILVHSPLRTEFFRHLPGILTGIGIIGTFTGLIIGLQAFHVSDQPDAVRKGLGSLIDGVFHAFELSASAITLAMVITAIEKIYVSILYKKVERLCLFLDSKFDAGAGEEYLERLVHASEESQRRQNS